MPSSRWTALVAVAVIACGTTGSGTSGSSGGLQPSSSGHPGGTTAGVSSSTGSTGGAHGTGGTLGGSASGLSGTSGNGSNGSAGGGSLSGGTGGTQGSSSGGPATSSSGGGATGGLTGGSGTGGAVGGATSGASSGTSTSGGSGGTPGCGGGPACTGFSTCCSGTCVDLNGDPANCGACRQTCPFQEQCSGGFCQPDAGSLGFCIPSGCPSGTVCSFGFYCIPVACAPSDEGELCAYPDGGAVGLCCGAACVDTVADPQNCSGCGISCGAEGSCFRGSCVTSSCSGVPPSGACLLPDGGVGACCSETCVDPAADSNNCGICGSSCPMGSGCSAGACRDGGMVVACTAGAECPAGTSCTGFGCLPLDCQIDQEGQQCAYADDMAATASGVYPDEGLCCGGQCVDTAADSRNCGACGVSTVPTACVGGNAFPPVAGDAGCVGCLLEESCIGGVCASNACAGNGGGTYYCVTSDGGLGVCCGTTCADPLTDSSACGGCSFSCPAGQTCSSGICSGAKPPCAQRGAFYAFCDRDAGTSICCPGAGCSNLETDPNNCGSCGHACTGGFGCVAGSCQ